MTTENHKAALDALEEIRTIELPAGDADLWICVRGVKEPQHDGDTGYEYYRPVRPYAEAQPTDDEVREALEALKKSLYKSLDCYEGDEEEEIYIEVRHLKTLIRAATAPKVVTGSLEDDITKILNEARCLSKETVGNRELARRIVALLKQKD